MYALMHVHMYAACMHACTHAHVIYIVIITQVEHVCMLYACMSVWHPFILTDAVNNVRHPFILTGNT